MVKNKNVIRKPTSDCTRGQSFKDFARQEILPDFPSKSIRTYPSINSLYKIQSYIPSKDLSLYTSRKAWMNQIIWAHEMKELYKKLGIGNRKILLLSDNCSSHKELQLENIKFLYFLPGATANLWIQVRIHKF